MGDYVYHYFNAATRRFAEACSAASERLKGSGEGSLYPVAGRRLFLFGRATAQPELAIVIKPEDTTLKNLVFFYQTNEVAFEQLTSVGTPRPAVKLSQQQLNDMAAALRYGSLRDTTEILQKLTKEINQLQPRVHL